MKKGLSVVVDLQRIARDHANEDEIDEQCEQVWQRFLKQKYKSYFNNFSRNLYNQGGDLY